jgi:hypothetical protein
MENDMVKPSPKNASVQLLFTKRMERLGRGLELKELIAGIQRRENLGYTPARWKAVKLMGYKGATVERKLFAEYIHTLPEEEQEEARNFHIKPENAAAAFEEAVVKCPVKQASRHVQQAWIESHPAMSRLDLSPNKTKLIVITPEDILSPPHGPCPDQATARNLQHWVNKPGDFRKDSALKKKEVSSAASESKGVEVDMGLDEVRGLLDQVESGNKPDMEKEACGSKTESTD